MAVRRLAPDEVQPQDFTFTPSMEEWAQAQIAKYPEGRQMSAVVPIMWHVQGECGGWLPKKALEAVAERLGMPYMRVLEVATFYTMFNLEPVGKHFVQVCGTTPCALRGANDLMTVLQRRIGDQKTVSADGNFTWLEVECLGACCNAPMMQINNDYYEDLTPELLEGLLDDLAAGRDRRAGSQQGRNASEPTGQVNTLQDPSLYDGSRVGAWRQRFEEVNVAAEQRAETEAASTQERVATEPRVAKPDAGRSTERPVLDAPAQRAAGGDEPVKPEDRKGAASRKRATVAANDERPESRPAPRSEKSYTATPVKPEEGRLVADAKGTTPEAGTPPRKARTRRTGAESKPDFEDKAGVPTSTNRDEER